MEAIKVLAGIEPESAGRLLIFDFARSDFGSIKLTIRPDCEVCQVRPSTITVQRRMPVWLCGSNTVNVNPPHPVTFDMAKLKGFISQTCKVLLSTPMVTVFEYSGHEISLFRKGRMLIKNVQNEQEALDVYQAVMKMLNVR